MESNEAVLVKTMNEALQNLAAGKSVILTVIDEQAWQSFEALGTVEYEVGENAEEFRGWLRILARSGLSVRINIERK